MTVLLVASSEARVGRSTIAAGVGYALASAGAHVTLARLAGDESADADAAAFAALEYLPALAPPAPCADNRVDQRRFDRRSAAGSVAPAAGDLNARVHRVAGPSSPAIDVPEHALAGYIVTRVPASRRRRVRGRANVLAALPEDRILAAPAVEDIARALDDAWLHEADAQSIDRVMLGTVPRTRPRRTSRTASVPASSRGSTRRISSSPRSARTSSCSCSPAAASRARTSSTGYRPREEVALLAAAGSTVETMGTVEGLVRCEPVRGAGQAGAGGRDARRSRVRRRLWRREGAVRR